jgi:putative ABC transport system permease protein
VEEELEEELQFHLEQEFEKNLRAGMDPREARRQALLSFGGTERHKEQVRDARGVRPIEDLVQDLRHAARQLGKRPGFAFVAVLTLALGIGANTAIFSLVNSLILKPLPFEGGDRLVQLWRRGEQLGRTVSLTPTREMAAAWRRESQAFDAFAAFDEVEFLYVDGEEPRTLSAAAVSPELLTLFSVAPVVGRLFSADDAVPGRNHVLLLSESLWRTRFGADPNVVGRSIRLDEEPYQIVGVLPGRIRRIFEGGFFATEPKELWTALPAEPDGGWSSEPYVLARLRPNVSEAEALAELEVIQAQLQYQGVDAFDWRPQIIAPADALNADLRTGLWVLFGGVAFVLFIACVNISNLLLARNLQREHEFAVRRSLGAGWFRVIRQLLTESLILSLVGAALGLFLAVGLIHAVAGSLGSGIPELRAARVDSVVLVFTAGLAFLTASVFGLVPALRIRTTAPAELLKGGGRGEKGMPRQTLLRNGLVVTEVALALVLLLGAGLLVNSFQQLLRVDPGFEAANLLAVDMILPETRYPDRVARLAFWDDAVGRVKQLPQVRAVTWARAVPPQLPAALGTVVIEGREELDDPDANPVHVGNWVSREYFETIGLPVRQGRTFSDENRVDFATPVIINRTVAERYWPDGGAVGSRIQLQSPFNPDRPSPWLDIVGVVDDVKAWWLGDDPDRFQFYMPVTQIVRAGGVLIVRTAGDPEEMVPLVQEQIWTVDPLLPIQEAYPVQDRLMGTVARNRFNALLMSSFAAVGLFLAVIGVFGTISLAVGQRTREIGVRIALGANRAAIVRTVVGRTMWATGIGILLGLALALALNRFIQSLLFQVRATDPATCLGVVAVLGTVAGLACVLPSRKAMAVDPREALSEE